MAPHDFQLYLLPLDDDLPTCVVLVRKLETILPHQHHLLGLPVITTLEDVKVDTR